MGICTGLGHWGPAVLHTPDLLGLGTKQHQQNPVQL